MRQLLLMAPLIAGFMAIAMLPGYEDVSAPYEPGDRIITTDWGVAETLLALDAPLIGVGEKRHYERWVRWPELPEHVVDFGVRVQPHLMMVEALAPTLIINSSWYEKLLPPSLARLPSKTVDFFTDHGVNWENSVSATRTVGNMTGKSEAANQLIANTTQMLVDISRQLESVRDRPVAVVQFIDPRTLRIYGNNSLYGVVLQRLHLRNIWEIENNAWGNNVIQLVDLANFPPDMLLLVVHPHPPNIGRQLRHNVLWQNLAAGKPENHRVLPAVWSFGGMLAIQRFAILVRDAVVSGKEVPW